VVPVVAGLLHEDRFSLYHTKPYTNVLVSTNRQIKQFLNGALL